MLKEGEELIIRDVWGAIAYKGEGYFIGGGAGITPFVAILRQLYDDGSSKTISFSFPTRQRAILSIRRTEEMLVRTLFSLLPMKPAALTGTDILMRLF